MLESCRKSSGACWKVRDDVETVNGFCYLGDKLNASGECETAVTSRTRLGWMKFRECGEFLYGKKFSLKMGGRIYRTCTGYAVPQWDRVFESEWGVSSEAKWESWGRAMCGVKLMGKKNTRELINMLGLLRENRAKASSVLWYGHVLKRDENEALRKALSF